LSYAGSCGTGRPQPPALRHTATRRPSAWLAAAACTISRARSVSSRPLMWRTRLVTARWNCTSIVSPTGRSESSVS
ncbi:MAG: hypothetical protein ACK559_08650, partial [bacterium]